MATVTVRFWAGARRAAGHEYEQLEAQTLEELRALLAARRELAAICERASFLVDGQIAGENAKLLNDQTVDVLPPFAGGEN